MSIRLLDLDIKNQKVKSLKMKMMMRKMKMRKWKKKKTLILIQRSFRFHEKRQFNLCQSSFRSIITMELMLQHILKIGIQ